MKKMPRKPSQAVQLEDLRKVVDRLAAEHVSFFTELNRLRNKVYSPVPALAPSVPTIQAWVGKIAIIDCSGSATPQFLERVRTQLKIDGKFAAVFSGCGRGVVQLQDALSSTDKLVNHVKHHHGGGDITNHYGFTSWYKMQNTSHLQVVIYHDADFDSHLYQQFLADGNLAIILEG